MDNTTVPVTTAGKNSFQEEAKSSFKQTSDNRGSHNGAISKYTAAHAGSNAVEDTDETRRGSHDDRHLAADWSDRVELY